MLPVAEAATSSLAAVNIRGDVLRPFAWLGRNLQNVALAIIIVAALRMVLIMIAASLQKDREMRRRKRRWWPPKVAILVLARNKQNVICKRVRSLLQSDRNDFDILVVDIGSSDNTCEVVRQTFANDKRVRAYRFSNRSKASALNYALWQTDADVIVTIDADTVLAPDAIELLVRHFRYANVGAVAGSPVVGNPVNLITKFQALEYVTNQDLDRRAFEMFNCVGAVPGAIWAWRRVALLEVKGYRSDTLEIDADLSLAIQRRDWKVIYEPQSFVLTEAPETLRSFIRQRFRWLIGTLQVAWKHSGAMLSRKTSLIGWIAIPNIFLFQFLFTLCAPVMDALLIWLLSSAIFNVGSGETSGGELSDLSRVALFWFGFQLCGMFSAFHAISLSNDNKYSKLIPLLILQRFSYRLLLYLVAIQSLLAAMKGRPSGRSKLRRKGRGNLRNEAPVPAMPAVMPNGGVSPLRPEWRSAPPIRADRSPHRRMQPQPPAPHTQRNRQAQPPMHDHRWQPPQLNDNQPNARHTAGPAESDQDSQLDHRNAYEMLNSYLVQTKSFAEVEDEEEESETESRESYEMLDSYLVQTKYFTDEESIDGQSSLTADFKNQKSN